MKKLMIFLVALAGLLYAFSIVYAGILSLQQQTAINSFLVTAVVLIGGVLSTNLGAVLGATFTPPQPVVPKPGGLEGNKATAKVLPPPKFLRLRPSLRPSSSSSALEGINLEKTTDSAQKIQIIACWFYIISLVLALLFYIIGMIKNIPNEKMVLIPDLVKTLLGVLAGSVAVALGGRKD
ncbi:hypothetical protein [Niastella sp. OAS944]|uniref:hypothetical protein n=1 Tax=Niastella sp. OAS944 TaxID=2664089 RepID=UPI0034832CEE|nr:ABC-type branched-subunit amino acid transport system permease subunit [Chitinophagaceae bacterium OAS944]